jgi:hypothetical protein
MLSAGIPELDDLQRDHGRVAHGSDFTEYFTDFAKS